MYSIIIGKGKGNLVLINRYDIEIKLMYFPRYGQYFISVGIYRQCKFIERIDVSYMSVPAKGKGYSGV